YPVEKEEGPLMPQ
ncbi:hypothetical protein EMWEY_00057140, partial [Eimeria maxima]